MSNKNPNEERIKKKAAMMKAGYQAYGEFFSSQAYSSLTRHMTAQDAIRLFLQPTHGSPISWEERQAWIDGWELREQEIRNQIEGEAS